MNTLTLNSEHPHSFLLQLFRIVKYPVVILLNLTFLLLANEHSVPFSAISVPMVLSSIALLILLEQIDINRMDWQHTAREWLTELMYFSQNAITGPIAKTGLIAVLALFGGIWENNIPFGLQLVLVLLLIDFTGYLMHRAYHDISWLWPIHAIHHAPSKVNVFNNNIAHFLNIFLGTIAQLLPVYLLGFSTEVILIATTMSTIHSFMIHSNSPMTFGPIGKVLITPAHHWLHHSVNSEEAGNHATMFTFWDRLGGTYVSPRHGMPEKVGLFQGSQVSKSFIGQVLHPFIEIGKVLKKG